MRKKKKGRPGKIPPARQVKPLIVTCLSCKGEHALNQTERVLAPGHTEVGIKCPHCSLWTHSYNTTPELKALRRKLAAAARRAGRSLQHEMRWRRLKAEYQVAYDRLNGRLPEESGPDRRAPVAAGVGLRKGVLG